jgi:hypothetical protein
VFSVLFGPSQHVNVATSAFHKVARSSGRVHDRRCTSTVICDLIGTLQRVGWKCSVYCLGLNRRLGDARLEASPLSMAACGTVLETFESRRTKLTAQAKGFLGLIDWEI